LIELEVKKIRVSRRRDQMEKRGWSCENTAGASVIAAAAGAKPRQMGWFVECRTGSLFDTVRRDREWRGVGRAREQGRGGKYQKVLRVGGISRYGPGRAGEEERGCINLRVEGCESDRSRKLTGSGSVP
jgi:hypothetical protein